jgi:hypothetical protein
LDSGADDNAPRSVINWPTIAISVALSALMLVVRR